MKNEISSVMWENRRRRIRGGSTENPRLFLNFLLNVQTQEQGDGASSSPCGTASFLVSPSISHQGMLS
jgi:hypothetical protein